MERRISIRPSLPIITEEIAEKLLEEKRREALRYFGRIEPKAAELLAKSDELLDLSGLIAICDQSAHALSTHKGGIKLEKLENLNDSPGHVALAATLADNRGLLDLRGLRDLGDAAAKALASHKGGIALKSLKSLSDSPGHVALAATLTGNDGILDLSSLTSLGDRAAEALAKHKGGIALKNLKSLGDSPGHVGLAATLANNDGILDLSSLTSLGDRAAEALAKHEGGIALKSLESLSDSPGYVALAAALTNNDFILDLSSLTSLGDRAAEALAKHKGVICLNKLNEFSNLSTEVAEVLIKHPGALHLSVTLTLSDAAAAALAKHQGGLVLNGLKHLNNSPGHVALAATLADNDGILDLSSLTSLGDRAAEALAKHKGSIALKSLKSLSDSPGYVALAATLAGNEGILDLSSLTSLGNRAAEALASHEGGILLSNLENLSDSPGHIALAATLADNDGILNMSSLTSLGDRAAEALAKHKGGLILNGLTSLTNDTAHKLAKCRGSLFLGALTNLSDSTGHIELAKKLADNEGILNLPRLKHLGDKAAEALSKHHGGFLLTGLTSLSDSAAHSLSGRNGGFIASCMRILIRILGKTEGPMYLDSISHLSDAAAKSLANYNGLISLSGLASLSDSPGHLNLAHVLSKNGAALYLDSLTEMSDSAAQVLAKNNGSLYLRGLTSLSDAAAKALANSKGDLHLDGLTSLSDTAAKMLAGHEGGLYLRDLKNLTNAASEVLAKRKANNQSKRVPLRTQPYPAKPVTNGSSLISEPRLLRIIGTPSESNCRLVYRRQSGR